MNPIPEDAEPGDLCWEVAFLDLAHGLVIAGAKARIVTRFTGLPRAKVRKMYKVLRGTDPPPGPVMQGSARFFAVRSRDTSAAWSIQSAILLACYERVGRIIDTPVHRGWRLLAAFTVYLSLTEKLFRDSSVKRLDINQSYALLAHCGFMTQAAEAELQRRECPACLISYPIVTSESLDKQACPVCAMNANSARLAAQAARLADQQKQ